MSSQVQAINLNENTKTIVAVIFSMNLLSKITREQYISNLFFMDQKEKNWVKYKPINIIAFFNFIKTIDVNAYNLIYIILMKKKKNKKK